MLNDVHVGWRSLLRSPVLTLAAVMADLGAATLAASYPPARRAMQINPLAALREE